MQVTPPFASVHDFKPLYMGKARFLKFDIDEDAMYYDGDTIYMRRSQSFNSEAIVMVRLNRINAPEVNRIATREAGLRSKEALRQLIDGKLLILHTFKYKDDKYGRYLGEIYVNNENGVAINANDWLVANGYAVYQSY